MEELWSHNPRLPNESFFLKSFYPFIRALSNIPWKKELLSRITSFKRVKWPQTKMHTITDTIFGQFFMHFHMVWSILLGVLALNKSSFWLADEEFQPMRKPFLKLTTQIRQIRPSARALKTVPKNCVRSCVHFCFRSLGPLERCGMGISGLYKVFF